MSQSIKRSVIRRLSKFLHQYCITISNCQRTISMCNTKNWVGEHCFVCLIHEENDIFSRKFEVNIWSSFEIKGNPDMTLEGFIKEVEVTFFFSH